MIKKAIASLAIAAASFGVVGTAANASVIVLGNSRASACYHAAENANATNRNVQLCQTVLREDPITERERTATHVNLGILYFYQGQYDAALVNFDRAIELDADEPEAYLNKAIALLRRDESGSRAVPLFTMALDMGTRKPALAYYGRGLAHELDGDLTQAYYDIRRATEADPGWDVPERDLARFIVEPAN